MAHGANERNDGARRTSLLSSNPAGLEEKSGKHQTGVPVGGADGGSRLQSGGLVPIGSRCLAGSDGSTFSGAWSAQIIQAIALITAKIMAMPAATSEMTLTKPPRTFGDSDSMTPMRPNTMATIARMNPQNAPVPKLKRAATIAMIEGMLKWAFVVCTSIKKSYCISAARPLSQPRLPTGRSAGRFLPSLPDCVKRTGCVVERDEGSDCRAAKRFWCRARKFTIVQPARLCCGENCLSS
jgi:hypothetical protein